MAAMFLRPLPVPWKISPSILNDRQRKSGGNQGCGKLGMKCVFFFHEVRVRNHAWKNGKGGPICRHIAKRERERDMREK
ncbi:hypothetical protein CEXT_415521 [Caerostris extrusa]|uniref:Uncharacterized protein n=1 Tax=Caerostris extrusa TaxID=172846 RepID=A0AAV4N2G5_CAEEX|nr:hypothetical protein CEXT_415521 [Caerostris extrusa]